MRSALAWLIAGASAPLALVGCASLPEARMAVPDALASAAPVMVEGLGGGQRGDFRFGAWHGRYERGASRLALLGRLTQDRAALSYSIDPGGVQAECRLRGLTANLGAVQLPLQRTAFACELRRAEGAAAHHLELHAADGADGTREERRGRFDAGPLALELQSVHRLQGSPLELAAPVGYLFSLGGRPVAALDLSDSRRPRLRQLRPPADASFDASVGQAIVEAALALALMWDPELL